MSGTIAFKPIYLKNNQGHGNARRVSRKFCANEIIALLYANGIDLPHRFKLQFQWVLNNKNLSIIGEQIFKYLGKVTNLIGIRKVPEYNNQLLQCTKKYCPMSQTAKETEEIEMGNTESNPPFSVAICVYGKDNATWFDTALESIIVNQTVKPSEIVLVIDGPVPEAIENVIGKYSKICEGGILLRFIRFEKNRGLGEALKVAIENCSNEIIARMDSDDIAVRNRFELQLRHFITQNCDICGGQIEEFIDDPSNVVGRRLVPESDQELKVYMKKRCPFNHMTVMYKKSAVMDAGNYQDWFWNEDYYLWIRMALKDHIFANLPETLVKVRVGKDMYARRGGDKYFKSEVGIQQLMLKKGMIGRTTYISNCAKRFIVQKMLPNSIRGWVFKRFARE